MDTMIVRRRLHEQIDLLPDELIKQTADFILFLKMKQAAPAYEDWNDQQWRDFALQQFFRVDEGDDAVGEVEYTLKDAREVYHP